MRTVSLFLLSLFLFAGADSCMTRRTSKRKQAEAAAAAAAAADLRAKDSVAAIMLNATLLNDMPGADKYHLVVSFFSRGQGVDSETHKSFKEFITPYDSTGQITADKYHWGREGETDYCIRFVSLDAAKQQEFTTQAKAILARSTLVHVEENADCKHKR